MVNFTVKEIKQNTVVFSYNEDFDTDYVSIALKVSDEDFKDFYERRSRISDISNFLPWDKINDGNGVLRHGICARYFYTGDYKGEIKLLVTVRYEKDSNNDYSLFGYNSIEIYEAYDTDVPLFGSEKMDLIDILENTLIEQKKKNDSINASLTNFSEQEKHEKFREMNTDGYCYELDDINIYDIIDIFKNQ